MTSDTPTTYPEAFVYLCAATASVDVAEQPLIQAPRGSVKGLVIMRARSGNEDADQRHCVVPAERLARIGGTVFGLKKDRIRYVDGHVDVFADYGPAIGVAQELARDAGASVLFNITAGRTQCKFGALFGHKPGAGVPLRIVSVGFNPFRVDIISVDDAGTMNQAMLPAVRRQSFAAYLKAHGLVESNRTTSGARARWRTNAALAAERLHGALTDPAVNRALATVQDQFAKLGENLPAGDRPITAELAALATATNDFEGVAGLTIAPDRRTLRITEPWASKFLAGEWLEALLFARLARELPADGTTIEVLTGVGLAPEGAAGLADIGDLDVAVYVGSALYVIEAKAGWSPQGANRAVQQLSQYTHRLLGVAGGAWLVAPRLNPAANPTHNLAANVASAGFGFFTGQAAVDQAVAVVVERVRAELALRAAPAGARPAG